MLVNAPTMNNRVVVLPIFKRYWLWHAWSLKPSHLEAAPDWRSGTGIEEKARLLGELALFKVNRGTAEAYQVVSFGFAACDTMQQN